MQSLRQRFTGATVFLARITLPIIMRKRMFIYVPTMRICKWGLTSG